MGRRFGIGLVLVVASVGVAFLLFRHNAATSSGFWAAFVPSAWANVIGVTVAAIIGIPIGFWINHYVIKLAEGREHDRHFRQAQDILKLVKAEINPHSANLLRLGHVFSASTPPGAPPTQPPPSSQTTGPSSTPEVLATLFLQDQIGRRAISDRNLFEADSLVVFEISSYYARVGDLNRLLNFRIQYVAQQGTWEREINALVTTLWVAQEHVKLEIDNAIQRLERQVIQ